MRIIAGEKRGTKLIAPEGIDTRPTLDHVKEALFGRLQFELYGTVVLDLFAGSGALGLEALSRGAAQAVFVENASGAQKAIERNIQAAGFEKKAVVLKKDYEAAIKLFQNQKKFDIVIIDPPYKGGYYERVFELAAGCGILAKNAVAVAESDFLLPAQAGYRLEKQKRYGKTFLSFYRWEEE